MNALKRYSNLYLMLVPVIIYFLLFSYYPLIKGLIISMQDYKLMGNRPFVGLANYKAVMADPMFYQVFWNTFILGGGTLIIGFIAPLILSLSLNEVRFLGFKKTAQMVLYVPHLLSWIVVSGIWLFLLSPDTGIVNLLLQAFGMSKPVAFLTEPGLARWTMILMAVWKDMGYNCILFLAGIVSINPSLYEAARMDGASRWQQIRYVTLPQLADTMKVVFLLNSLGILQTFDQVFVLRNPAIAAKVDVVRIFTYQKGIIDFKIAFATATNFYVILFTLALTLVVRKFTRFDEV